jgi:REP element-mobilizing transposase RayT
LPFANHSAIMPFMSRPLRIEFPGAVYHVTSRGDRREDIFADDADRSALRLVLEQALQRFDAQVLSYCLMSNHYHFVLHTRQGNLSRLMRHVNGVYTQRFNRRHGKVGHLFQGRFNAILVDRDSYLLAVCRYVELNPVRAGMVPHPGDWAWSSYRAHVGAEPSPEWLDTVGLHEHLLGRPCRGSADRRRAAARYAALVAAGRDVALWDEGLRQQIYLGDEGFVTRMLVLAEPLRANAVEVPRTQRGRAVRSLQQWLHECATRDQAIWRAYRESGLHMSDIAAELGLSVSRISRLIAREERGAQQARDKI